MWFTAAIGGMLSALAAQVDIPVPRNRWANASGRRMGQMLDHCVAKCGSDLLVMGAHGQSRLRKFIPGVATEHMLHDSKTPLFLVHSAASPKVRLLAKPMTTGRPRGGSTV